MLVLQSSFHQGQISRAANEHDMTVINIVRYRLGASAGLHGFGTEWVALKDRGCIGHGGVILQYAKNASNFSHEDHGLSAYNFKTKRENEMEANQQNTPAVTATADPTILETQARDALRKVYDPELGMSVIELGLIRKFDWRPNEVDVTMILTTPFCPYGPAMIEQVKQATQESTMLVTKVQLGLEMWEPSMMEDQAAANWGLYY